MSRSFQKGKSTSTDFIGGFAKHQSREEILESEFKKRYRYGSTIQATVEEAMRFHQRFEHFDHDEILHVIEAFELDDPQSKYGLFMELILPDSAMRQQFAPLLKNCKPLSAAGHQNFVQGCERMPAFRKQQAQHRAEQDKIQATRDREARALQQYRDEKHAENKVLLEQYEAQIPPKRAPEPRPLEPALREITPIAAPEPSRTKTAAERFAERPATELALEMIEQVQNREFGFVMKNLNDLPDNKKWQVLGAIQLSNPKVWNANFERWYGQDLARVQEKAPAIPDQEFQQKYTTAPWSKATFEGVIDRFPITMELWSSANTVKGYYLYTAKNQQIKVEGAFVPNQTTKKLELHINVLDANDTISEQFFGQLENPAGTLMTGRWLDLSNGSSLTFTLNATSVVGGTQQAKPSGQNPAPKPAEPTKPLERASSQPAPAPVIKVINDPVAEGPQQAPKQTTPPKPEEPKKPNDPASSWKRDFTGSIDGKHGITMHLERSGDALGGYYFYSSQGDAKKIAFSSGVIDPKTKVVKLETANGEVFQGAFADGGKSLSGSWTLKDKTIPFEVKVSQAKSGKRSVSDEEIKDLVPLLPEKSGGFFLTTPEKALLRKYQAQGRIVWVFDMPENARAQNMQMSEHGISELKNYEGYGEKPYQDSAGYWTIGYGHLIDTNKSTTIEASEWKKYDALGFPRTLNRSNADKLLRVDIPKYEKPVKDNVKVPITQDIFDVLTIMAFNIPAAVSPGSGLLQAINEQRYLDIPEEMYRWVYAGGKKLKGLENRRLQEMTFFARPYIKKSR
jgi:lysozyme